MVHGSCLTALGLGCVSACLVTGCGETPAGQRGESTAAIAQSVEVDRQGGSTLSVPAECGNVAPETRNGYFANDPLNGPRRVYSSSQSLTALPGSAAGVPGVPLALAIDCPGNGTPRNNEIRILDPASGSQVAAYTLPSGGNWYGFDYRPDQGDIIALSSGAAEPVYRVYSIRIGAPVEMELLFEKASPEDEVAVGIAWDPIEEEVAVAIDSILPDDDHSVPIVRRFRPDGGSRGDVTVDLSACSGGGAENPGGLLVSSGSYTLGCNQSTGVPGGFQEFYALTVDLDTGATDAPVATEPTYSVPGDPFGDYDVVTSDLACDTITSTTPGVSVVWGLTRSGTEIQAFEVPEGTCQRCNGVDDLVDSDGDGLFDEWEINGIDLDCDGVLELDLPAMGADPNHKDLFLEFDWWSADYEPLQKNIRQVKAAFYAAPPDAGGTMNPDGRAGIRLWVDTGSLTDPNGIEGGFPCTDGIDNDGDGAVDEEDIDCVSGFGVEGVGGCTDGVDNDGDGLTDGADADCSAGTPIEGGGLCNDGVDNDEDCLVDLDDPCCQDPTACD